MSLLNPQVGEAFRVRTEFYHQTNPAKKYSVNNTVICAANTVLAELTDLTSVLATFFANICYNPMVISRTVVSTFVPDTSPYQGDEFYVNEHNLQGLRILGGKMLLPLKIAMFISKQIATGRSGKMFLRGALAEEDVEFGQELFAPSGIANLDGVVEDAVSISGISSYFYASESSLKLCVGTNAGVIINPRLVENFEFKGIRSVSVNHRYYDQP